MTTRIATYLILILFISFSCKSDQSKTTSLVNIDFSTNEHYKFTEVDVAVNMAYLDIGNSNDPIVLLLHGEPNNSFVYRNIAPQLIAQNFRVIIPDLVGFGYSDKPKNIEAITYSNQTKWLNQFIENLKLENIHLFAHDWGGMISLRIVAKKQHLFSKVAVSYSYLFEGTEEIPESFKGFVSYAKNDSTFLAGNIMDWGSNIKLSDSIKSRYNVPFKTKTDYNFVRSFPSLIPTDSTNFEAIVNKDLNIKLNQFNKPFITIWGDHEDLMWIGKDSVLQQNIKGAQNQKHFKLKSNHFIQEDQPDELSKILIGFFKK
jgi:haloalkane dehalogenase